MIAVEHSVAGPLSSRILADLGADVLKVERARSEGDFARHWDTHANGESAQFWWLNRRKRSVVLDLHDDEHRAILSSLLEGADVLVYNMSPSAARRAGLDPESLRDAHPRLIACQISGYGADSESARDRKAYDMLIQAEAGIMSLTGTPEEICRVGVSVCDVSSGLYAALLILAALVQRETTGRGTCLDVAMLDVALEFLGPMLLSNLNSDVLYDRSSARHHAIAPYGIFTCRDGARIVLAIEQDEEWRAFCRSVLEDAALADNERFATNSGRIAHRVELDAILEGYLRRTDRDRFMEICDSHGFAYGRLNDVADVGAHPVLAERGVIASVESAEGAPVLSMVGVAERAFPALRAGRVRPPQLDEDREEILRLTNREDHS